MAPRPVFYVLSSHWDREWYETFQNYRVQLVQMFDRLIEGWESGRLRGPFQCDGQAILLEDYLEVRSGRAAQARRLVAEGKIVLGPWYTLPDEFLVSGESLVRNLRMGREVARQFGGAPSNAGFACDLFGHVSQMPQIFRGFGIQGGFLWRGTNSPESRHLIWRGADGTELPCYRYAGIGYCDLAFRVRGLARFENPFDASKVEEDLAKYLEEEAAHSATDAVLLFDGADHQEWDPAAYERIFAFMETCKDRFTFTHSTLDAYLEAALAQRDSISTRAEGELREAGRNFHPLDDQMVIHGVASSRVWIKQANCECQTLLCHWAEPLSALAALAAGREWPEDFLRVAWRWLLQNHPHDSICGCSIDEVHENMKFRFSQTRQIAERLTADAAMALAAGAEGEIPAPGTRVVVFNPLPRPLDEIVELTLQIPPEWPDFGEYFYYESKPSFRIFGLDGVEIPYQRLEQSRDQSHYRVYYRLFTKHYKRHHVRVALPLRLPAMGYTTLTIQPPAEKRPTRHPETPALAASDYCLENEFLRVSVEPEGCLTLLDKRTNQEYRRLLTFEDRADIGDGWYHGEAVNDQWFTSRAARAEVALVHNGPFMSTLRARLRLEIPARFDSSTMRRSQEFTELLVDNYITLRRGADFLEIETRVENTARDHRLRVLFPTGAQITHYLVDTPFDVTRRAVALHPERHLWKELEVEQGPMQSWVAAADSRRGLAVLTAGLLECAVRDLPERPIALTLFRSTGRTVMTNGEPGGQLPGPLTFRYRVAPLAGEPDRARMFDLAQRLAAGVRETHVEKEDLDVRRHVYPELRGVPASASFCELEGQATLTSLRLVAGALEARVFNPCEESARCAIRLPLLEAEGRLGGAEFVNLESAPLGETLEWREGRVEFTLAPKQIRTLRVEIREK